MLRFYIQHGRFPRGRGELPDEAVAYVARQVGVPATDLAFPRRSGRTVEYRAQIRKFRGSVCARWPTRRKLAEEVSVSGNGAAAGAEDPRGDGGRRDCG